MSHLAPLDDSVEMGAIKPCSEDLAMPTPDVTYFFTFFRTKL